MSVIKDDSIRKRAQYLERVIGQALLEGADMAVVEKYLVDECGVTKPDVLRDNALRKSVVPRLGAGELKRLGGRDGFRKLFGLDPADEELTVTGTFAGVDFRLNEKNQPDDQDQDNVRLALEALKYSFAYDLFADLATVSHHGLSGALTDAVIEHAWLEVDREFHFRPSLPFFTIVINDLTRERSHHPVLDYLTQLPPWDMVERLDTWLIDYAGAADSAYVRAVSALPLLAAVRRVRHAGQLAGVKFDELLVLVGPQGQGKSKLFSALCPKPQWFSDSLALGDEPKVAIERSRGIWLSEIPELQGSPRETERIKAYLSRSVDGPARMAYSRLPVRVPRQFINFGTTNDRYFLRDPTGNRRFWPVVVTHVDPESLAAIKDQLWAETLLREARGDSIRLDPSLYPDAAQAQEAHREEDPWEELITNSLDLSKAAIPVAATWTAVGFGIGDRARHDQRAARRIGNVMGHLGFPVKKLLRVHLPNQTISVVRCWVKDPDQSGLPLTELGASPDGKLPF